MSDDNRKNNDLDLPNEFLKKIVSDGQEITHLCKDCNSFPICVVSRGASATYEGVGVGQTVITCPYYISMADVEFLDKRDGNEDKKDD